MRRLLLIAGTFAVASSIQAQTTLDDTHRTRGAVDEFYFKSPAEMKTL